MLSVRLKDFIFVQFYIVIHHTFSLSELVSELEVGCPFLTFTSVLICWYHHSNWNLTKSKIRKKEHPTSIHVSIIMYQHFEWKREMFFFSFCKFQAPDPFTMQPLQWNGRRDRAEKMKNMQITWNTPHTSWVVCPYKLLFMLLRIRFRRHCVCERINKMRPKNNNKIDKKKI